MPIIYACVVNRNGTVVVEGMSSDLPTSMKRYVVNAFNEGKLNSLG